MGLGNCNGRSDLNIFLANVILVQPWRKMPKGIHGDDLLRIRPLRKRTERNCGFSVGEIWLVIDFEFIDSDSERMINAIRTTMGTNCYMTLVIE